MGSILVVPLDPVSGASRAISSRLRSQLHYFARRADGTNLGPDEFLFDPDEVTRWLDDGVLYVVSPLDTANFTELELTEEQEDFLIWLRDQGVRHARVIVPS
jgi:hypothetical protein